MQQVVSAIAGNYGALARAELTALRGKPPADLRSYDCVLRAYDYLQNHSDENHALARECLEKVVEAEPDYADGLAWLGYIYADEYHHRRNERLNEYDALDRALELGLKAVRLDDASHVTHGNLGLTYYFRGDYERGDFESRRAMELAMEKELQLEKSLRALADKISEPKVRDVFLLNAKSTNNHYQLIESEYARLMGMVHESDMDIYVRE